MKRHYNLNIWQEAIVFVKDVYFEANSFFNSEIYGLTSQIKRVVVSIPSNIAEGASRQTKKEFIDIDLGLLNEVEKQLIIAKELNFMSRDSLNCLLSKSLKIKKITKELIKYLKEREHDKY